MTRVGTGASPVQANAARRGPTSDWLRGHPAGPLIHATKLHSHHNLLHISYARSFILTGFPAASEAPGKEYLLKILVCMKQVPQKDAPLKLNEAGNWIRDEVPYEVNEPDAFALEEALRQREKHTGEVVVITSGAARAQQVLREALAKGADRAIHLEDNAFVGLDAFNTAKAFAAAIKDEKFDLIFTGLQSDDYGYAQT